MQSDTRRAVLITGASTGIGATYADRFARRGHDLVLVARDAMRLADLASRLRDTYRVAADVLPADLTDRDDLARVAARLREDASIGVLVNNAGATAAGGFAGQDAATLDGLIALNVSAVTQLAAAAVARFLPEGNGAIVNLASVLAIAPEVQPGIYSATKAFVLTLSQSLQREFENKGVYVQAVLPAATRTEIWQRAGLDIANVPGVMAVDELVDAALVGFDRREAITIPPLPDEAQWQAFQKARTAMLPNFRQEHPAARYRI